MSEKAQFSTLGHDLVDRILTTMSDFSTLSAAIRTSKSVYGVFQTHPNSIARAVLWNAVGPSLPAAIMAEQIQYSISVPNVLGATYESTILAAVQVSRNLAEALLKNAQLVDALENFFSWRRKDRSSSTSKLTPTESERFHLAIYRIWWRFSYLDNFDDEAVAVKDYLNTYSTDELLAIRGCKSFLNDTLQWSSPSDYPIPLNDSERSSAPGLSLILDNIEDSHCLMDFDFYDYDSVDGGLESLTEILVGRKFDLSQLDEKLDKAILDEVVGQDECHRCSISIRDVDLWGPSNWILLAGCIGMREGCNLLDGHLPRNVHETRQLINAVGSTGHASQSYVEMIQEMFELEDDPQGLWSKTEWFCIDCMRDLFRERLRKWWLAKKQRDGVIIGEDCWYGYNCRTQTHKMEHASRLNHLCVPTRGDAPATAH